MQPRRRLPATVIALGVVSFLTDIGTEMVFPLLPMFLTAELKAGTTFLGLIEGTADSVASLLKLISGYLADRWPRKPLVLFGYGLPAVARPLIAFATAPWQVLAIRVTDRIGKGMRSSPRDALIADAAVEGESGRAFGFHQAMDHTGAVTGPLIATALLAYGFHLRSIFLWAAIPGVLALLVVLTIREPRRERPVSAEAKPTSAPKQPLPKELKTFLLIVFVFAIGNSSDAFLLLQASNLGVPQKGLPLLWSVFHVSKVVSSYGGGWASDRVPRAWLIVSGWAVFAGCYWGFGLAHTTADIWALFIIYGAYYGLTEPTEKALIRDLVPVESRGRAFGLYNFIVGMTALPAGLITGALWKAFGPRVALMLGASLATVAAGGLVLWNLRRQAAVRR